MTFDKSPPFSAREIVNQIQSHDATEKDMPRVQDMLAMDYLSMKPNEFRTLINGVQALNTQELTQMGPIHSMYDNVDDAGQLSIGKDSQGNVQEVNIKVSGWASTSTNGDMNLFKASDYPRTDYDPHAPTSLTSDLQNPQIVDGNQWKVQSGDNYWKIAKTLNPSVSDFELQKISDDMQLSNGNNKIIHPDDVIPIVSQSRADFDYDVRNNKNTTLADDNLLYKGRKATAPSPGGVDPELGGLY